jgi:hypothetical protein
VNGTVASSAQWRNGRHLLSHFGDHAHKMRLWGVNGYDRSARETIEHGARFKYTWEDPQVPGLLLPRVGYYHRSSNRFTALTDDEVFILTHYPPDDGEDYVRNLRDSTYSP